MEVSLSGKTPPRDMMSQDSLATVLFAGENLKDVEARLGLLKGVSRTCAGYAGGGSSGEAGKYPEAVLIEYFPQTLSYGQLVELLMDWYVSHPGADNEAEPVIFYQTAREKRLAQATVERNALLCGTPRARVLPFKAFYEKTEGIS